MSINVHIDYAPWRSFLSEEIASIDCFEGRFGHACKCEMKFSVSFWWFSVATMTVSTYQWTMHVFPVCHHCIWCHAPTFQSPASDTLFQRNKPSFVQTPLHPECKWSADRKWSFEPKILCKLTRRQFVNDCTIRRSRFPRWMKWKL